MSPPAAAFATAHNSVLDHPPPAVTLAQAVEFVRNEYGITASASELIGERDRNFHLQSGSGAAYVLKFVNAAESLQITNFQTQMLLHLQAALPDLPLPHVIRTHNGKAETCFAHNGQVCAVRLVSYLDGIAQYRVPSSLPLMHAMGSALGRMDVALADFQHPGATRDLLWNSARLERFADKLCEIRELPQRSLIENFMARFDAEIRPQLATLRTQVIHNDLNPHNVIVASGNTEHLAGIIDFGDSLHAPLVNNLATALSYQIQESAAPFAHMQAFATAYVAQMPLQAHERALLPDLIMARMVLVVGMTHWRAERYPEKSAYILRNNPRGWAGIKAMSALSPRASHRLFECIA